MRPRAVHQVLVGAGTGDAITSMAIHMRDELRRHGPSEIYAHFLAPDASNGILPLHELGAARPGDLLVYHASYGEPRVTQILLARTERLVLVYHNITPAQYFVEHDPAFASGLNWGRFELRAIRQRVVLAVAVSAFNARDLEGEGYRNVHVIPAGLNPSRLVDIMPSGRLASQLGEQFPNGYVLCVSQLLPHKRFEIAIEALHLVQWVHQRSVGLVIAGPVRWPRYQAALHQHAIRLNVRDVWFAGHCTEAELAALFRGASMYVTTSAHEGLALPPLEAMSFGVPVIARAAGALTETLQGAGIVLAEDAGPMLLSEAIVEVLDSPDLRAELRRRGRERVAELGSTDPAGQFVRLVQQVA